MQQLLAESEFRRTHKHLENKFAKLKFADCPVSTTLGVLGKKWSLLILRDISSYKVDRFSRLLESLPGIPPKVLATRLKELQQEGLIWPVENRRSHPKVVRWALTEKGVNWGLSWHRLHYVNPFTFGIVALLPVDNTTACFATNVLVLLLPSLLELIITRLGP